MLTDEQLSILTDEEILALTVAEAEAMRQEVLRRLVAIRTERTHLERILRILDDI